MSSVDTTVTAAAPSDVFVPDVEITVTLGGEVVARRVFTTGEYVLGSDEKADLRLDFPFIAGRHARLEVTASEIFVEDLGGPSGTLVNGRQIGTATRLQPSQKIQVGAATIEAQRVKSSRVRLGPIQKAPLERPLISERKYEIGEIIARGGMGLIIDARDSVIRRNVAMKIMLPKAATEDATRFIQEAQITGQLEHPGVVPIYELGVDEQGKPFYTMKFVRGITLRHVLEGLRAGNRDTIGKFPLAALLMVFQKICDAIAFAHFRGVIHRDLKPGNIMLGDFGEVLVMDWGLAKMLGASEAPPLPLPQLDSERQFSGLESIAQIDGEMTAAGTIMGTPQFMSPEQARGEIENLDARSDIYALGAILYQILTLRPAVEGANAQDTLEKVRSGEITPPDALPGGAAKGAANLPHLPGGRVPESLSAVCMKALAKEVTARYENVSELQKDILAYQNGFATMAERATLLKHLQLAVLRHKTETTILLTSICLVLAFAVFVFERVRKERDIAESERNTAKAERDRAETTLQRLQATAPTFLEHAKALLEEGKFDDALSKISFAISLKPGEADYALFRANLLESTQHLKEAADEYRHVLNLRPGDTLAKKNLSLCEYLYAENKGAVPITRECQVALFEALMSQGRRVEAAPLALTLRKGQSAVEEALRARLKEYSVQAGWTQGRIRPLSDGMFDVNLNGFKLGDLQKLVGFPIQELDVGNTGAPDLTIIAQMPVTRLTLNYNRVPDLTPIHRMRLTFLDLRSATVTDLAPLAGMPLESLYLDATHVHDLSPLKGMPLKRCSLLNNHGLRDISPLAGLPIEELDLTSTGISDLSALRGMPLRHLALANASLIEDFTPILNCQKLEELSLPFHAIDVAAAEHFPNLHSVSVSGWTWDYMALSKFRSEILPGAVPYLQLLAAAAEQLGKKPSPAAIQMDADRRFLVNFAGLPVQDLKGFEHLPIKRLNLSNTKVHDVEKLRKLPLQWLRLDGTPVSDVAPLTELTELEQLVLPHHAKNVAMLRNIRSLRYISETWNHEAQRPAQTAADFWAQFDAPNASTD